VASGGRQSARAQLCSSSACSSLCQCGAKCTSSWTLQLSDALCAIGKHVRVFMRQAVELSFALQWWSFQTCTLFRPGDSIATSCFMLHIACSSNRNLSMSSSSIVTPSSAAAGAATCASALMPADASGTSSLPCRSASGGHTGHLLVVNQLQQMQGTQHYLRKQCSTSVGSATCIGTPVCASMLS
jgi:hypothetical protein